MQTHLTRSRWLIEVIASTFGVWFGAGLLILLAQGDSPLWWVGWSPGQQSDVALAILAASLVHATGINLNGGWRWSPLLRLMGIGTHAGMSTALTLAIVATSDPHGVPSGFLTYSFISLCLWVLTYGCWRDLVRSLSIWKACHG